MLLGKVSRWKFTGKKSAWGRGNVTGVHGNITKSRSADRESDGVYSVVEHADVTVDDLALEASRRRWTCRSTHGRRPALTTDDRRPPPPPPRRAVTNLH